MAWLPKRTFPQIALPMTTQIRQVAITYLTRRSLWLVTAFALLTIGPTLLAGGVAADSRRDAAVVAMFPVGFGSGILAWILLTQAKWQFCDPRARLLPHYARAHLAALLGLIVLGYGVCPPLGALLCQWNPLGVSACMAGVGASFLWSMHSMSWAAGLLAMAQILSLATQPGLEFWVLPASAARYALVHAAILAVGWTGLLAWLRRLPRLREEDPDYLIPIQAQQGSATRMERTQASRTLARQISRTPLQAAASDRWLDRLNRVKATGIRGRQWLLRYGYGPTPILLNAAWFALLFGPMMVLMTRFSFTPRRSSQDILPTLNMLVVMPSFMAGGMFVMRRARLGHELLLPLSRRQFLNGIFATAAWNVAVTWAVTHATLLGLVYWGEPTTMTPKFVVGMTALSLAAQACSFGAFSWMARFQSGGARMIGTIVAVWFIMGVLSWGTNALPRQLPPAPPDPGAALIRQSFNDPNVTYTPDERRALEQHIERMEQQQRQAVERIKNRVNAARVATTAAAMAIAGLGLFAYQQRRWMQMELG